MQMDTVLKEIGEFGWYQKRVYILVTAPTLLVAFETLSVIFIFFIPDHRCIIPGYDSDTFEIQNVNHSLLLNRSIPVTNGKADQCHVYNVSVDDVSLNSRVTDNATSLSQTPTLLECRHWVYDKSTLDSTIATDFDVVCGHSLYRAGSNMISELGTLSCAVVSGFIADRFGRKLPFYVGGVALVGGGFGIAFVSSLPAVNICRFILGLARPAVFVNGLVIGLEIVGPSKRAWAGILIEMFWCVGEFLLLLVVYFIRNWRYLEIALSVPSIALLFYWWLIPESPRWLLSRGRGAEALQILDRVARFVIVVVYYGLTLNITNLSGNIFVNYALNAVLETVGYGSCLFLLDRLGRKPVLTSSMILAGAACTLSFVPLVLELPSWVLVALSMLGRFSVCVAYATIFVYAGELFPTVVRSSCMGLVVTFSRVGSIIAPFIADGGLLVRGQYKDALPLVVLGSPALAVGVLSVWLPETLNTPLPETVDDLQRATRQRRRLSVCCRSSKPDDNDVTPADQEQQTTSC